MSETVNRQTTEPGILATMTSGVCCCVLIDGPQEAQVRLKRLGICEGRKVTVLQSGDPMILGVVGTQVAVSRHLAASVQVRPVTEVAIDE